MILVFIRQFKNGKRRARLITGVTDISAFGDSFLWKREGQKSAFHFGIDADTMAENNAVVYAICGDDDCAKLGVGEDLIKWVVWNHEFIAHMLQHEANRFIKLNPLG
jgi:hypothetical protein